MAFVWTTKSLGESQDTTKAIYLNNVHKDYKLGEEVVFKQKDKRKSVKHRIGKVVGCFTHHIVVQFKNYRESFKYYEIERA